jgi:PLP dependent protein
MNAAIDSELLCVLTERVRVGLGEVRATITALGMDPATITIIGVTKGWGVEAPLAGLANGLEWFGENYAEELVGKASAVRHALASGLIDSGLRSGSGLVHETPKWTFQGKLQSNKINRLKTWVSLWQTVDNAERAKALGSRVPGAEVLIQVVLDDSGERSGCGKQELPYLIEEARAAGLQVRGLMGIAPDAALHGAEATRAAFAQLQKLAADHQLEILSMGMTDDYAVALSFGATHLRLGSRLFGLRSSQ